MFVHSIMPILTANYAKWNLRNVCVCVWLPNRNCSGRQASKRLQWNSIKNCALWVPRLGHRFYCSRNAQKKISFSCQIWQTDLFFFWCSACCQQLYFRPFSIAKCYAQNQHGFFYDVWVWMGVVFFCFGPTFMRRKWDILFHFIGSSFVLKHIESNANVTRRRTKWQAVKSISSPGVCFNATVKNGYDSEESKNVNINSLWNRHCRDNMQ